MNKPYVKKFNRDGVLINPIEKSYVSERPNRRQRRRELRKVRFHNNRKGGLFSCYSRK